MAKKDKNNGHARDHAGTITKVKDKNYFMGRVQLGYKPDGKPYRPTFYGKTEGEVDAKIREAVYIYSKGECLNISCMKLSEWMIIWLETYKKPYLKEQTLESYMQNIRYHIDTSIGKYNLMDLNHALIQSFINQKMKEISPASVRKIFFILKPALEMAVKNKKLQDNPAEKIKLPSLDCEEEIRVLTEKEQEQFLYQAYKDKDRLYSLYVIGFNTGLRIGELLALNWGDVDFEKRVLKVSKTVINGADDKTNKIVPKIQHSAKTKSSKREVPLNEMALKAIIDLKNKKLNPMSTLLFPTQNATLVSLRNAARSFTRIALKTGLSGCNTHSMRHTFASRLFSLGVDIKFISKLLGHKDVSTTYDIYVHILPSDKKEVVEKLDLIKAVSTLNSTPSSTPSRVILDEKG